MLFIYFKCALVASHLNCQNLKRTTTNNSYSAFQLTFNYLIFLAEINYETELEHEDDEVDPNLYKEDYMFLSSK